MQSDSTAETVHIGSRAGRVLREFELRAHFPRNPTRLHRGHVLPCHSGRLVRYFVGGIAFLPRVTAAADNVPRACLLLMIGGRTSVTRI